MSWPASPQAAQGRKLRASRSSTPWPTPWPPLQPNVAIIFVPARFAPDAIYEAVDNGIPFVICITEGIPGSRHGARLRARQRARGAAARPELPGADHTGSGQDRHHAGLHSHTGPIGLVSRSGTLTYEVVDALTKAGLGQTTAVGIGGDPVIGTSFVDVLGMFEADPDTKAIVMIGEIGGSDEEQAAAFIKEHVTKPVVGFIAGQTAPPGKRMGHAGAIISGGSGTAAEKMAALTAAGVHVVDRPSAVPAAVKAALGPI